MNTVKDWFAEATTDHHATIALWPFYGEPDDAPEPGAEASYDSDWFTYDGAEPSVYFLEVPETTWGYGGGLIPRSNYETLVEDFPGTFIKFEVSGNATTLLLPLDATLDDELPEVMFSLLKYGLRDDEHYWMLEQRLLTEWWDTGGIDDFMWDLEKAVTGDRTGDLADFKVTKDWVKAYVWTEFRRADWPVEVEDAYTVQFTDRFYKQALEAVEDQLVWDWNAKVTWLTDRQEGLF